MLNLNKNHLSKNKEIYAIVFAFIIIYILHLLLRFHFVLWDEAVYIGIGKYLFSLGKIGIWEDIRPLGLPIIFGAIWKICSQLGFNLIIALRIIEMLFAAGTIILVYLISLKLFGKKTAIINSLIYAMTPLFFYNSLRLMSEIPSTFFMLLAIYFFIEERLFIAGFMSSLAFIFRYQQGLIIVSCLLVLFIEFFITKDNMIEKLKKIMINSAKYIIGFTPLIGILFVFNYLIYPSVLYPILKASEHQNNLAHTISNIFLDIFYYPINLYLQNILFIFALIGLFILFFAIFTTKLEKRNHKSMILIVAFIIYLTYLTSIINKQERFALMFLPFLVILTGYSLVYMFEYITILKLNKIKHQFLIKYLFIFLIMYIIFAGALSLHRNYNLFLSFPKQEPMIVKEYYKFFPDNYEGLILTSDPVHIAYTDIKMIPFYLSVKEGYEIYNKKILDPQVRAVIFIEEPFLCFDKECEEELRPKLFSKIKNNKITFEKQYEEIKRIYYTSSE